jgi:hypothetical protein
VRTYRPCVELTVQRYIDLDRAIVHPLLNAVAGALLQSSDEGGVVDEAIKPLARRDGAFCRCMRHIGAVGGGCHIESSS